ncbi:hypothetical protein MOV76_35660 [Rhizobium sp. PRIMUS64]|nr:hypothetical protein [Rhizobium sp. PRIMUS64]MCJ9696902.1 hypothetical protein [Rhizobium sp. PRIMUS64]
MTAPVEDPERVIRVGETDQTRHALACPVADCHMADDHAASLRETAKR